MKSYVKPTNEQVEAALPLLSSPQHEAYFFSRLENPLWISPLAERDVFKHPPKAEPVEGGGVRFPPWPPSRYLARMAAQAPAEVAEVFVNIETDNTSIIGDIVEAALIMPSSLAASLIIPIARAAREGVLGVHFKDASDLCVRLVEGRKPQEALRLAEVLYTPTFVKDQDEPSLRDVYWYQDGLRKVVPVLSRTKPREFLPKLCNWLNASIRATKRVSAVSGDDYSYIWRPAIEEHAENKDYDFAGTLAGLVREGCEAAVRDRRISLDEALKIVGRHSYLIFERIKLHLIGEFSDQNPELTCKTIMDRQLFESYQHKHEYAMLVGKRLPLLLGEQREQWFQWVDAGPDMSGFDDGVRNNLRRDPTDEDRKSRTAYWQFEKLHWVREHLQGERLEFYKQMVANRGEPEMADFNVRISAGWVPDESPITVDELSAMTFEEAVRYVSSWSPEPSRFEGPNMEGLGSKFKEYIATKPVEFSSSARMLVGRPAIFVRGFIEQMSEAVKAGQEIDVPAVLDLCEWVVNRPIDERTTAGQEHEALVDENWQWTRDEIARFAQDVCKAASADASEYPFEALRGRLWQLIETLCQDRAESYIVHDVSQDDPRLRDYLDLGINSPRGKALEAALEYARWVANDVRRNDGQQETFPRGFEAMPEVRKMLEWQIAPINRSFEAMAVIGSRIPVVYRIDREWLADNADRIFSLEDIEKGAAAGHGWAAWNAFLVWVRPHIEFYRLFKSQFSYAVDHSGSVRLREQAVHQPMYRLGEHLMILYGRGQLGLEDDGNLVRRFFKDANPEVRRHAITFIGQSLDKDDEISEEIISRFRALWELYWAGPGKADAAESRSAWLFGTWFACGKFPKAWALDQLQQFVEVNPTPEPDHAIVPRLADIANIDIVKSVQILDMMVRGDREGWRIGSWRDADKEILTLALKASGPARETAQKLIDYLGRRGFLHYGRLLS